MTTILETPVFGPKAWDARTQLPNDGRIVVTGECHAELDRIGAELAANPGPVETLGCDDFDMPACRDLMAAVRVQLEDGIGFAIIDRLRLDDLDIDTAKRRYWLLMSMLGPPVAQKWDGAMLYDVIDTRQKGGAGTGVRSSKTNRAQGYHTDNSFNLPPDFVALLCLRPAMEGGLSGLVSFEAVYNHLLSSHTDIVPRLYRPFYFDRQREHAPDDTPISFKPILETDGKSIAVSFSPTLVRQGYEVAGVEMDEETETAVQALEDATEDAALSKSFAFERGQIQVVNNRQIGHRRTGFKDGPDETQKRHLVRIWIRRSGRASYFG